MFNSIKKVSEMTIKRPHIILDGIQIKSIEKAKKLAKALDIIEKECGIHETRITIKRAFICPDIDIASLSNTPMECVLNGIIDKIKD